MGKDKVEPHLLFVIRFVSAFLVDRSEQTERSTDFDGDGLVITGHF